jgi:hypothetical protein
VLIIVGHQIGMIVTTGAPLPKARQVYNSPSRLLPPSEDQDNYTQRRIATEKICPSARKPNAF